MADQHELRLPLRHSRFDVGPYHEVFDADGNTVIHFAPKHADLARQIVVTLNEAPALHARIEELEAAYTALANRYAECAEKLEAAEARVEELTADLAKERLLVDVTREAAMVRQAQAERAEARVTELTAMVVAMQPVVEGACAIRDTCAADDPHDHWLAISRMNTLTNAYRDAATQAPAAGQDCCKQPRKATGHTRVQAAHCDTCGADWQGGEGEHDA